MSCAVFVIVKDENYFLPKWISYYKQFFKPEDIYVLDHQSTDGSTDNLDVNVVKVTNDVAVDHQWLKNTVESFQKKLLETYKAVLFTESDEFVYCLHKPLNEYIQDFLASEHEFVTCVGYEMVQDLANEKPLADDEPIMPNRNNWVRYPMYDKSLLSKIPLDWAWGFHGHTKGNVFDGGLHLIHLHRHDFEMMVKRHELRVAKWKIKDDGDASSHQKIADRGQLLVYFHKLRDVRPIPAEHKAAITGL